MVTVPTTYIRMLRSEVRELIIYDTAFPVKYLQYGGVYSDQPSPLSIHITLLNNDQERYWRSFSNMWASA